MSSLSSEAQLIVATFQLLAVRDVTNAIHSADIESGDVVTPAGLIEQPRRRFLDSDRFTPSSSPQSSAVYQRNAGASPPNETRQIERERPKLIARPRLAYCACPVPPIPNTPATACDPSSPIQPPWKVLPWMDRYARSIAAYEQVKRQVEMSDIADSKGPIRGTGAGEMIDVVI